MELRVGDRGQAVVDLQERLADLGLAVAPDLEGEFGPGTAAALQAFQHRRGLRVDGWCGSQTWNALVEAGFRLGDRFLYLRSPMFRGDDVADLQHRLSALGFDCGRVDGIFGARTSSALGELQRNVRLPVDGILGASTLRELKRVTPRPAEREPELVSVVRDRERLRHAPRTLLGRRIAVGEEGGLDAVIATVRRRLAAAGAQVVPVLHHDGSQQASLANAADVEAYLGLRLDPRRTTCSVAFYSGYSYESAGGRRLAELVESHVTKALGMADGGCQGMSLPVLRETRMPAVVCELGPARVVVERAPELAGALVDALTTWALTPVD